MANHHHHDDHEAFDFVNAVPEETRMKEAGSTASVAKFAAFALVGLLVASLAYGVLKPTPLPEIKHHAGGHETGHAAGETHSTESAAGGH